jgi:hypothetical protein
MAAIKLRLATVTVNPQKVPDEVGNGEEQDEYLDEEEFLGDAHAEGSVWSSSGRVSFLRDASMCGTSALEHCHVWTKQGT